MNIKEKLVLSKQENTISLHSEGLFYKWNYYICLSDAVSFSIIDYGVGS